MYSGGSQITFSEAPKADDKLRIYYYRASDDDVLEVDILETVKTGDQLTINKYPDVGLDEAFQQESRTVTGITTSDTVTTNTYVKLESQLLEHLKDQLLGRNKHKMYL